MSAEEPVDPLLSDAAAAPLPKRRRGRSPTSRTLERLRRDGYLAGVVEISLPRCHIHRDLFGIFDILAVRGDVQGCLAIQTTSASNHAARRRKMLAEPNLRIWLQAGNHAEVWSWRQVGRFWKEWREGLFLTDLVDVPGRIETTESSMSSLPDQENPKHAE